MSCKSGMHFCEKGPAQTKTWSDDDSKKSHLALLFNRPATADCQYYRMLA
jgi:hypothetical protein